jgi:hypothetical protein
MNQYTKTSYDNGIQAMTRGGLPVTDLKIYGYNSRWPFSGKIEGAPIKYKQQQVWDISGRFSYDGKDHELDLFEKI